MDAATVTITIIFCYDGHALSTQAYAHPHRNAPVGLLGKQRLKQQGNFLAVDMLSPANFFIALVICY